MASPADLVLVTGGSGFIAAWCIIHLVQKGYRTRTTVRNLNRTEDVKRMLKTGGLDDSQISTIEFSSVDLLKDEGWAEACIGCKYMLHVASPFPPAKPKHEDDVVKPAVEGTLRAVRFAKSAGIQRVVVTSSVAAVAYGHTESGLNFTEKDWSVIDDKVEPDAYQKSKTLAEKAVWDWNKENPEVEIATVCPALVFGPVLGPDYSTSIQLVRRMMVGELPGLPQLRLGCVDVRDVADLHILAMEKAEAKGERFIATTDQGYLSMKEMSLALKERLGEKASKCPTFEVPNFVLKIVGLWDPQVALIKAELGKVNKISNAKAHEVLGWTPRDYKDAIVATAESLEKEGLLKK